MLTRPINLTFVSKLMQNVHVGQIERPHTKNEKKILIQPKGKLKKKNVTHVWQSNGTAFLNVLYSYPG